jgi:catechol 2,3-dioxygenase-like lactoylglutathione lyase family enzyme
VSGVTRRHVVAGALAGATLGDVAAAADAAGRVSRLVRTALFVSDLDASTTFFRDVLGLPELFYEGNFSGPALERLLGLAAGARVSARILKAEGPPFGMIGLFEVAGVRLERVQKRRGVVNVGESVLVFYLPALDPLVARLQAAGHTIVCPPTPLFVRDGVPVGREMTFYAPDDVLVNVIERDHAGGAGRAA